MAAKRSDAGRVTRYRILAAEAHSWSSLLLEDERGQRYLFVVDTGALTKITATAADDLLAKRTYRSWHGARSWAPLDQFPLLKQASANPRIDEIAVAIPPGPDSVEAHSS
jgi:hypothetical protein